MDRKAPQRFTLLLCLILLAFSQAACPVRFISSYDEVTDRSLTALQQKADDFVDLLMQKAGTDEAAFDRHKAVYAELDQQVRRLEFRVASIPDNSSTVALVRQIRLVLLGEGKCSEEGTSLKDLHCLPGSREKGPSARALEIARRNINQTISAALSLELAKKQGS